MRRAGRLLLGLALTGSCCLGPAGCDREDDPVAPSPGLGTVVVDAEPDSINAAWELTGPDGFSRAWAGDLTLADLPGGSYALTWAGVEGWTSPRPATVIRTLAAGRTATFTGTYAEVPPPCGTIVIDPQPYDLGVSWQLSRLDGFGLSGTGDATLADMTVGIYTLAWGSLEGWTDPDPAVEMQSLQEGATVTFTGAYRVAASPVGGFVLMPTGTFLMGSPVDELGRQAQEIPHQVTLTRPFFMGTTEVTVALWDEVMGAGTSTSQLPKTTVTWYEALEFCNALSLRDGFAPAYAGAVWNRDADGYRLPTEAEWEFACRAGSGQAFTNGDISVTDCTLDPNLDALGWYCGNSAYHLQPVGRKEPNALGLYDLHGNASEWCWDGWDVYPTEAVTDPVGGEDYYIRIIRGGCYANSPANCRSAYRFFYYAHYPSAQTGFRLARTAPSQ